MSKWWKKISFWNKLKTTLVAVSALIQAEMIREEAHWGWNAGVFVMTVIVILITNWFQDNNNNGIIDIAE